MVEIIYNGDITPCRIKAGSARLHWKRGETKDLGDDIADKILENRNFSRVDGKSKTKSTKSTKTSKKKEKEEDFDLDGDGDFDEDDVSLAGKTLAASKKKNKDED